MNVLLVLLAFWLPGLLFGAAIRLRGWTLAAAGPLLTFGLIALGIPVLGGFGIRWTMLNVALWTLVVSGAVLAVVLTVPVGVAAMCHAWRMPPIAVAAAAAVSTCFTVFPYDSLWRGPLWPYVAGVALIPAMLAVARHLLEPRGIAGPVAIGV